MYDPFLTYQEGENRGKYIGKAQIREKDKVIIFPSGAKLEFSFLDIEADIKKNWQGAQLTGAYFEEFGNHKLFGFNYVRTRMRSKSKYKSFIRCTLNPEPNHFCLKYLDRFIDQDTGLAIKSFSGRPAYYVTDKGETIASWDKEELLKKYPKKKPRMYTFIPSSLEDNPAMLLNNEEYAEDLASNDRANAELLLLGNWKYKPNANGVWDRSVTQGQIVDHVPLGCSYLRAWDKASSKPESEGGDSKQRDPDYTASIGFAKSSSGYLYVYGNYVEDREGNQRARFREKPGVREDYILAQCSLDGEDTVQLLPSDGGQGGVFEYHESAKLLQNHGYLVKKDPSVATAAKAKRFDPFVSACHNKTVFWVKSSFSPEVWEYMMLELENFNQLSKNNGYHDDLVDCCSSAYKASVTARIFTAVPLPTLTAPTMLSRHRSGRR